MEDMSAPVPPAYSRREERKRQTRRRNLIRAGIAVGSVLVLVAIAAVVWVGFAPPPTKGNPTAVTTPLPTISATPTPTPSLTPRIDMAQTPPMGWNSWNQVGCPGLNAQVVENAADNLVQSGLKAAGYDYVVVDDCWQSGRDAQGNLIPDPKKFPQGMKAVADYVHKDGLKFGIYAVPGTQTCGNYFSGYPIHGIGSLGHEQQDANLFASWGVDYLKYDWCRADINDHLQEQPAFEKMEKALDATGRNIVLSISEYGVKKPWLWAPGIANLWRTTHDIHPNWPSIQQHIDLQVPVTQYAKPGAWNDPDMLEIGDAPLTPTQDTTHFAMWCMLAAPLFLGTDISKLSPAQLSLVSNPELIAIDQDAEGHEAHRVSFTDGVETWERPLSGGSYAVALYNAASTSRTVSQTLAALGIPAGTYSVRDVVNRKDDPSTSTSVGGTIPGYGIITVKLTPKS